MSRKSKEELGIEIPASEISNESNEQILLKFEDLTVSRTPSNTIKISKTLGGISDHTYRMFASGGQKYWYLYKDGQPALDTGNQNGNRAFLWEGNLDPGLYTLGTGPTVKDISKHRIPGRGYQIMFRV